MTWTVFTATTHIWSPTRPHISCSGPSLPSVPNTELTLKWRRWPVKGRTRQFFGEEVAGTGFHPPAELISTRVLLPTSANHLEKMVGIDCMGCSGDGHLLPDVFSIQMQDRARIYRTDTCTCMLHMKYTITSAFPGSTGSTALVLQRSAQVQEIRAFGIHQIQYMCTRKRLPWQQASEVQQMRICTNNSLASPIHYQTGGRQGVLQLNSKQSKKVQLNRSKLETAPVTPTWSAFTPW